VHEIVRASIISRVQAAAAGEVSALEHDLRPWRAEVVRDSETSEILVREWHKVECKWFEDLIADDDSPARLKRTRREREYRLMSPVREVTVKVCGVAVTRSQGHSWAPHPLIG
jgi:hypothetical protein